MLNPTLCNPEPPLNSIYGKKSPVKTDTQRSTLIITQLVYPKPCKENNMCQYVPIWQNRSGT